MYSSQMFSYNNKDEKLNFGIILILFIVNLLEFLVRAEYVCSDTTIIFVLSGVFTFPSEAT